MRNWGRGIVEGELGRGITEVDYGRGIGETYVPNVIEFTRQTECSNENGEKLSMNYIRVNLHVGIREIVYCIIHIIL